MVTYEGVGGSKRVIASSTGDLMARLRRKRNSSSIGDLWLAVLGNLSPDSEYNAAFSRYDYSAPETLDLRGACDGPSTKIRDYRRELEISNRLFRT